MALQFKGGKATSVSSAEKARMAQAIDGIENAIEKARQVASELMASPMAGSGYNSSHLRDIQGILRSMGSQPSGMRNALNGIK